MENKTTEEVTEIIVSLDDPNIKKEVSTVRKSDPVQGLKTAIFESFVKRLNIIFEEEGLKKAAEKALIDKILADQLTVPQLISVLNSTKQSTTLSLDSLFSLLRPVPNATNPMLESVAKEGEDSAGVLASFDDLSNEDSEKLSKLIRVMEILGRKETNDK